MYFSSIRPEGYGDRDIYYAELIKEQTTVDTLNAMMLSATVRDASSQALIEAVLKVYELDNEGSTTSNIKQYTISNALESSTIELPKGKSYLILVESQGYKPYSEKIDLSLPENHPLEKLFSMSKEE